MQALQERTVSREPPVVQIENLTKYYATHCAVDRLNLTLFRGEILGLLGPNGAGKTTVLRLLLGFLSPSKGDVRILGVHARSWKAVRLRRTIGYLPGDLAFDEGETAERFLQLLAHLSGCSPQAGAPLCERLGLTSRDLRARIRTYSRGMKQKLGLVAALQHDPEIIILDEPTNALDPTTQNELYAILRERASQGAAILFSTHVLAEALELCDRIALLSEGHLLDCFNVAEFVAQAPRLLYLRLARTGVAEFGGRPPRLPFAEYMREEDGWLIYHIPAGTATAVLQEALRLPLADIRVESAALEHLMSYYRVRREASP